MYQIVLRIDPSLYIMTIIYISSQVSGSMYQTIWNIELFLELTYLSALWCMVQRCQTWLRFSPGAYYCMAQDWHLMQCWQGMYFAGDLWAHDPSLEIDYRNTSNIRRILVGNKNVDHSDVKLEHRLSALLQLHLHSRLDIWLQGIRQRKPQGSSRIF